MARRLLPLVFLAALAIPASASASTICVAPATGCAIAAASIPEAVTLSFGTTGPDTITLGAATYTTPVTVPLTAQLTIVGQGTSATKIAPATATDNSTIVDVQDSGSSLRDLSISIPGGTNVKGLALSGTADNVAISAADAAIGPTGLSSSFFFPAAGAFRHGSITLPMTSGSTGTGVGSSGTTQPMTVEDSTIEAPLGVSGTSVVRRSKIIAAVGAGASPVPSLSPFFAPYAQLIEDTVIQTQAISSYSPAIGINAKPALGPAVVLPVTVYARHDTIVGDGGSGSIGIVAAGGQTFGSAATGAADARNVIIRGFEHSLSRTGLPAVTAPFPVPEAPADLTIAYSDFDPSTVLSSGPGGYQPSNNISGDPQFADGEYRLATGSPAIDSGDPGGLAGPIAADPAHFLPAFAAEGGTDRDGNARIIDGNRDGNALTDMGAYEAPTPPPPSPASPAPVANSGPTALVAISGFGLTNKVFAIGAKATAVSAGKRKVKRGTEFRYTLSRSANVTISVARKSKGFRKGKKCVTRAPKGKKKRCTLYKSQGTLKRAGVAGLNRVSFSGRIGRKVLKPGSYRATIVATDAAGKSAPRTINFTIIKG